MTATNTTRETILATFRDTVPEIKRIIDGYKAEHPNAQIIVDGDRMAIYAREMPALEEAYEGSDGFGSGFMEGRA
mgnify:FL=1